MLRYIEKEVFHYRCLMHYGWQGLAVLDEQKLRRQHFLALVIIAVTIYDFLLVGTSTIYVA